MTAWYGELHEFQHCAKYDRCGTNKAQSKFVTQSDSNARSEKNHSVFDIVW